MFLFLTCCEYSYQRWTSCTASLQVSPGSPFPANPGTFYCPWRPLGGLWSPWRSDQTPCTSGSQTCGSRQPCRCWSTSEQETEKPQKIKSVCWVSPNGPQTFCFSVKAANWNIIMIKFIIIIVIKTRIIVAMQYLYFALEHSYYSLSSHI